MTIRLLVGAADLSVAQLGPDFLFVDAPFYVPPCEASIAMKIDGNERTWTVYLPDGISANSVRVAIATAA